MKPPKVIQTQRLQLRPPVMEDAELIFQRYAQDREVTRYLTWRPHVSIQETEDYLQRCLSDWKSEAQFSWVILLKETQLLIGMVGVRFNNGAVIGYVLAKKHWGQRYMSEAVQVLVDWALTQESIYRVWSVCDVENRASVRVLEKVGMNCEGVLRKWFMHPNVSDQPRDCYMYAKIK